jgi:nicotinate-nucleotide adenylyltransferase
MVALAAQGEPAFLASTLEAPHAGGLPNYSVETAQTARRMLGVRDRLYFILGMDSFLDLPNWKDYRRLSELVDFIVAARPGFGGTRLLAGLKTLLPKGRGGEAASEKTDAVLSAGREVKILTGLRAPMASRDIRRAASAGRSLTGLVPRLVEEYIVKEGLYRSGQGQWGK